MNVVNTGLVRTSQAFVGMFFISTIASYFGLILLIPLGILYHFTNLFAELFGINGIVAMLFSIPLTGTIFYYGYKIDGMYTLIINTGINLIKTGKTQVLAFEQLLNKAEISNSEVAASK